jgi:hypothetical protein
MSMADPASSTAAGFLGVKYAVLVAGFAGGVISLAYLQELSRGQMVIAVLAGSACAGYLTPVAIPVLAGAMGIAATPHLENAAAFLLGLTSMNIIPGLLRLSEIFRRDPAGVLRGRKNRP